MNKRPIYLLSILLVSLAMTAGGCKWFSTRTGVDVLALGNPSISNQKLEARARKVLFDICEAGSPALRCNGLETMALMAADAELTSRIRMSLEHPSVAVRFAAAVATGDIQDYSAKFHLEQLLRDKDPSIKMAAAYALEKMGDKRFGTWYDQILKSKDAQLCSQACLLIGKLGKTKLRHDSVDKLRQVLRKQEQDAMVKLQAAEALARLGDQEVLNNLLVYANSGYASDRLLAISGLVWLKNPTVRTMLTVLADDEHIEVRLTAIRVLGSRAEAGHLEVVRDNVYYQDPDGDQQAEERIRGLALLALGEVGSESDAHILYKAMDAESGYYRVAAARATVDFLKRHRTR